MGKGQHLEKEEAPSMEAEIQEETVEEELDVDYNEIPLQDEDAILLCTDGLTNFVSREEILSIIRQQGALASPDLLVEQAMEHGGNDNITVVVISQ